MTETEKSPMSTFKTVLHLFAIALLAPSFAPTQASAQNVRKIVLIASPKDHGLPGRHEYEKDLKVLAYCMEHASNLKGITTKVVVGRATSMDDLKDAALIVIHGSGDRSSRETNPLFPPNPRDPAPYPPETIAFLNNFDALMKKGVGLAILHYTTQVANETARKDLLQWVGGYYLSEPGVRNNPRDEWSMTLKNPTHPVLRGIEPWTYKEEIFTKFLFADGVTPLIVATPAEATFGPREVAWAFQRTDGGRGFGFGGMDFHSGLALENPRRLLLNGLVWAAGMDVPAGGVASIVPDELML